MAVEVVAASFIALDQGYIAAEEQSALYVDGEQLPKSINACRNTLR
ncbi:MAG: hypothetical protein RBU35_24560 [Anaerolineae bacterium]|jgi:hypothetical protein|nr:hypothetical protein [Anaerolineae bacterium]